MQNSEKSKIRNCRISRKKTEYQEKKNAEQQEILNGKMQRSKT